MSGIITAAVITSAATIYSAERQRSMAKDARRDARDAALRQERAADEATNRANQKSPDVASLLAGAQRRGLVGGTMLTGPQGVDASALQLGKNSLLGS